MPVVPHRRSDRDDDDVGGGKVAFGREANVDSAKEVAETRLAEWICSATPRVEPSRIALDARHPVSKVRKDGRGDRTDITCADDAYTHRCRPTSLA